MSDLTKKDVFDQMVKLQDGLQKMDDILVNIKSISDCNEYSEGNEIEINENIAQAKIHAILDAFMSREATLKQMLCIYEKMYDELNKE